MCRSVPSGSLTQVGACFALAGALLAAGCAQDDAGDRPGGRPGRGGPVAVTLAPVAPIDFAQQVEALGTARANESIDVTAKVSGIVTRIAFSEGQAVRKGDVLVTLEDSESQANLAEANAALVEVRSQYDRAKELFATRAVSRSDLDQLEATVQANEARVAAATARLSDFVIRAPFAGRVGLRNVSPGSLVSPGEVITTLDDTSVIKLDFSIPETFLSVVNEGMTINAESAAYRDRTFEGRVLSVDTRVDPLTRSVAVRARVNNDDNLLKPGMFLTVGLIQEEDLALAVPEEALVPEQDRQYVFVVEEGAAKKQLVSVGRRKPGWAEITSGLSNEVRVVLEGTQKLRDGASVRDLAAVTDSEEGRGEGRP